MDDFERRRMRFEELSAEGFVGEERISRKLNTKRTREKLEAKAIGDIINEAVGIKGTERSNFKNMTVKFTRENYHLFRLKCRMLGKQPGDFIMEATEKIKPPRYDKYAEQIKNQLKRFDERAELESSREERFARGEEDDELEGYFEAKTNDKEDVFEEIKNNLEETNKEDTTEEEKPVFTGEEGF